MIHPSDVTKVKRSEIASTFVLRAAQYSSESTVTTVESCVAKSSNQMFCVLSFHSVFNSESTRQIWKTLTAVKRLILILEVYNWHSM